MHFKTGHCHSEDFSAIHQSHYIMNISNDRKTFLEFFLLIWRGELMNIMICLSTVFRNWLRQPDREGWLRCAAPPANLWKGWGTDPQRCKSQQRSWSQWVTLIYTISDPPVIHPERVQKRPQNSGAGERGWLCDVLLSCRGDVGHSELNEPSYTSVCSGCDTHLSFWVYTAIAYKSCSGISSLFYSSSLFKKKKKKAKAYNDRDNSPVTSAAHSVAINVSLCVFKVCAAVIE